MPALSLGKQQHETKRIHTTIAMSNTTFSIVFEFEMRMHSYSSDKSQEMHNVNLNCTLVHLLFIPNSRVARQSFVSSKLLVDKRERERYNKRKFGF